MLQGGALPTDETSQLPCYSLSTLDYHIPMNLALVSWIKRTTIPGAGR
jgi:hypothetical protein